LGSALLVCLFLLVGVVVVWEGLGVDFDQLALLWRRSFDVLACCLQAAPEAMEIIIIITTTTMSRIG
jgi:hypothetical protein